MERDIAARIYLDRISGGKEVYLIGVPREDGSTGYLVKGAGFLIEQQKNQGRFWFVADPKKAITLSVLEEYPNIDIKDFI